MIKDDGQPITFDPYYTDYRGRRRRKVYTLPSATTLNGRVIAPHGEHNWLEVCVWGDQIPWAEYSLGEGVIFSYRRCRDCLTFMDEATGLVADSPHELFLLLLGDA